MAPVILALFLLQPVGTTMLPKVDTAPWNEILRQYVNQQHLVDYSKLKQQDWKKLREFVGDLGHQGSQESSPDEIKALLINAYNSMTMEWIIENYPVQSIWDTQTPFKARRFLLGGESVSLDEIESRLREMKDPRIHAALVCAARSCPPLRSGAYVAARLDEQLDANVREWLANSALNKFYPERHLVTVSPIFKWYSKDFDAYPGGLRGFLLRFGPPAAIEKLRDGKFTIRFANYHWGLNDQYGRGLGYSSFQLGVSWLKNWILSWSANLGRKYNVNPAIFGGIYVGAIPFFTLCIGWIIRNMRRRKSIVLPVLAASFFFISAYLYLLVVGRNIPAWVYAFIFAIIGFGVYSTVRKIRAKARLDGKA
ncbi:MAG: DUF547 domain-containing protein [Acidobacteria bacterium]|nr:MAG: DUF547 domain-containing protein [Acidobacteriota bacterium]